MEADLAAIRSASQKISRTHTEITGSWRELAVAAEQLLGGTWRGHAAKSYVEPWDECKRGYQDILDSLKLLGESVARVAQEYGEQEQTNTETINASYPGLNL
ncbi:hypothetical protein AXK57_21445 [Tsukamurella pulmonis]|nr:hypothetical protein AXK57_21445 [Tsukamurella pulmonis]RDH13315.1 WXG100 family type VII secretion target [Tsukamurella pulmonis]